MKVSTSTALLVAASGNCCAAAGNDNTTHKNPTFQLGDDVTFNFHYMTALGDATSGGADIGPVLGAVQNIKAGDMDSFSEVFHELANRTKAQAEDPENAYDPINVRDTWFSTAQYFRRADMFIHQNWSNPLLKSLWTEQTAAFNKALATLPIPGERIRIPAPDGNFTVDAVWYAASENQDRKRPTLVITNGLDAAQEDSYHYFVADALARGWNCITYEGPGHPTVRREQDLGFIPDWERVTTPVVDYVLSEKAHLVDENSLALVGNSFGGYLAARAAAFEPRLSAVVLLDGVWDTHAGYADQLTPEFFAIYEAGNYTQFDEELTALRENNKLPTGTAWGLDYGLWAFRTHSPSHFFNQTKDYGLKDVVDKIQMPVFVGDAEFENIFAGQPKKLSDALGDKATYHRFNGTAGYHCQTGAGQESTRTMFAWLNKTLNKA